MKSVACLGFVNHLIAVTVLLPDTPVSELDGRVPLRLAPRALYDENAHGFQSFFGRQSNGMEQTLVISTMQSVRY